jgi:hypothetical protein
MKQNLTADEIAELSKMFGRDEPEPPAAPFVLSFGEFSKGDYEAGTRNLYIVWRDRQALYIGISTRGIYNRWFTAPGCHMEAGTTIAQVIERNRPASMGWVIELRRVIGDLRKEESRLIVELRPLFNGTPRPLLTPEETKLYYDLQRGQSLTDAPGDRLGLSLS